MNLLKIILLQWWAPWRWALWLCIPVALAPAVVSPHMVIDSFRAAK